MPVRVHSQRKAVFIFWDEVGDYEGPVTVHAVPGEEATFTTSFPWPTTARPRLFFPLDFSGSATSRSRPPRQRLSPRVTSRSSERGGLAAHRDHAGPHHLPGVPVTRLSPVGEPRILR